MSKNKRIFLSYKFTGVPISEIHRLIDPIYESLKTLPNDVYCKLYDLEMYGKSTSDIMKLCLSHITPGDIFLLVADNRSENYCHDSMIELVWVLARNCTILGHIQSGGQYDKNGKLCTSLALCHQINIFQEIGDVASLLDMIKIYI